MASTSGSDPAAELRQANAEIRAQNIKDSIESAQDLQKSQKIDKWSQALMEAARKG
ncbi:hypothetical protein ACFW16_19415 [Inquilinus sp. NPDC058860]|uniref:hypothetical protein n=1 Tax=Inquilinus sp. NPDC058860 TaxID=3346652 RepID=UPI0036AB23D2